LNGRLVEIFAIEADRNVAGTTPLSPNDLGLQAMTVLMRAFAVHLLIKNGAC
jgi:hypothetical protein